MTLFYIKLLPFHSLQLTLPIPTMNETSNDKSLGSASTINSGSDDLKERLITSNNLESKNVSVFIESERPQINVNTISYTLLFKLCALGFFINFQPSESYLTSYLEDTKNFSDSEIDNDIWPYDTYGALISLLPIGICAEHFGFRKIIFFGLICRECTRLILLYGTEIWQMSIMQLTYASATSVNWVYYAYIYMVIIEESYYQTATSYVQSAGILGTLLSSILAQILVSYTNLANNYTSLFYLSWISTTIALLSFFILPKPNRTSPISIFKIIKNDGFRVMFNYIYDMYFEKSGIVQIWSIWWIGGYASYSIYSNYYQNQFIEYNQKSNNAYGFVNGVIELSAILGSLIPVIHAWRYKHNKYNNDNNNNYKIWVRFSYSIVLFSCIIMAGILSISVIFRNLYISYICNSIMFGIYHFELACACSCIAYAIGQDKKDRDEINDIDDNHHYYAMLFTFNSFLGLFVATIAQLIGSAMLWSTSIYYCACVLFHILTIMALIFNKYCRNTQQSFD